MKEKIRKGYTTGSCCAAGAAAALTLILTNEKSEKWNMVGPTGLDISVPINSAKLINERKARAIVIKDGGDDPDVTTGAQVIAKVTLVKDHEKVSNGYLLNEQIYLKPGIGIGIVTKPGLACPQGRSAVNPVPRKMILTEVLKVCEKYSYEGKLMVEIEIPKGVELAEKTFNPKLGITGGISVLGTTGVVEPMSSQAIIDTVKVELSVARALREEDQEKNKETIIITPGNYGLDFLGKSSFVGEVPVENIIKASNFIGDSVELAAAVGFEHIIVSGHLGKMIKVAGGMLNTHSKYGDNRIETAIDLIEELDENGELLEKQVDCQGEQLLAEKNRTGGKEQLVEKISEAVMVDEILRLVKEFGGEPLLDRFSRKIGCKVGQVLKENLVKVDEKYDKIKVNVIIFTNKFGLIYEDLDL